MEKQKQILKELEKKLNGKNLEDIGEAILKNQDLHCAIVKPLEKWEYKIEIASMSIEFSDFEHLLNYEGENGWELVTIVERIDEFRCIFKRKIQQG